MAKKTEAPVEKVYVIPLRKAVIATRRVMRAKKAVGTIKLFIMRHTRSKDVRLSQQLNHYLWAHGAKKPPAKVKVKVSVDPELNSVYPGLTASRVEIGLKSGKTLAKRVDMPLGDPRNPMAAEGVADKLRRFAARRDEEALNRVVELSLGLEELKDIRELTSIV